VSPGDSGHETTLIYVIGRVDQGIRRAMRAGLADFELSVAQYTTLSVLDTLPGLSNAQLARRALVTPQSMIEILGTLERRGLVRRALHPGHARILRARLTDDGCAVLQAADTRVRAIEDEMLAGVSQRERAAALRVMRAAMDSLSGRA